MSASTLIIEAGEAREAREAREAGTSDLLVDGAGGKPQPGGATSGIGYFARFGVTEAMIGEALSAALSRGGDYADVFFQHRVSNDLALEDGAVNRAFASVELGVGVRVVKGDQTGYGYSEDLSLAALRTCAQTAAAIADGPSRGAPQRFHVAGRLPERYPLKVRWEEIRPEQKLPILDAVNARIFAADPRVKKVSVHFRDESGAVLLADSQGRIVEDLQPMTLLYVSCLAEQNGQREQGGYHVAGRAASSSTDPTAWVAWCARRSRGPRSSSRQRRRQRARCRSCWRQAPRASSCTRPSATAWRPTSTERTSRSTLTRSENPSPGRS